MNVAIGTLLDENSYETISMYFIKCEINRIVKIYAFICIIKVLSTCNIVKKYVG